jgi:tRNA(Arg) A34 adenosine deaminase TadA
MRLALDLAREAARAGEVPVGAVVARGEAVIATSGNMMRGLPRQIERQPHETGEGEGHGAP